MASPPNPLHAFARTMPKVELHLHLEGSITPETALALARRLFAARDVKIG